MSREDFEYIVEKSIGRLPKRYLNMLDNVRIVVEDEPSQEQREKMHLRGRQTLYGLYEGVPVPNRGQGYNLFFPDKITIFQKPIEQGCGTLAELEREVEETVWHEIAHHLGLDEDEVAERSRKRNMKK